MKYLIPVVALLFSFGVFAQGGTESAAKSYSFNLNEAIAHALEHNAKVINAGRDIEISRKKKWETTAAGLPQINAGIDYQYNMEIQKSVVPAEFFGGQPGEFTEVAFGTKQSAIARSTLSQLLFDGSYIVALQASKTYLKYYQNAKQKTDADVRETIINAYGTAVLTDESIKILQRNKQLVEKLLSDTQETFKNGLIEEENVEQLQLTLASIQSNLNNVTRLKNISYNMLKYELGLEIQDQLTLTQTLDQLALDSVATSLAATNFDVKQNIDYKILENFNEQKRLEYKLERSRALPSLAASVNFGYNTFSNNFSFFEQQQRWLNYSFVGVSLNVPIFSSLARSARTQQAKIAIDQAKTQLVAAEQALQVQFAKAKSDFDLAVEEFQTAKKSLDLAERIERKQQIKFVEGLSTSFDYNDAQKQLYSAQQSFLQTMSDIINKRSALERVTSSN